MNSVDDEIKEEVKVDVEDVVRHLFAAYQNVKWICLNASLNVNNQNSWKDHWCFVGFESQPVYKMLDGFPAWVYDHSVETSADERAVFFLHVSSKNHTFNGSLLQPHQYEFVSPRRLCWRNDGGKITRFVTEEVKADMDLNKISEDIADFATENLFKRAMTLLEGKKADEAND